MLSSSTALEGHTHEPHLYDLVATRDGLRVSPTCVDGHLLVMELLDRLGLADRLKADESGSAGGQGARGDWNSGALPILLTPAAPRPEATPPAQPPRRTVGAAVAHPSVSQRLHEAAQASAKEEPKPNTVLLAASPSEPEPSPSTTSEPAKPKAPRLLSELTALHLANLARGPKKATSPVTDRRYILNILCDVLGDKPVVEITADDANRFADVLASWPCRLTHHPELKGLPAVRVAAITKKKRLPVIQRGTQGKHIMGLNAFFNWCVDTGAIPENPFHYVQASRYRDQVPKKKDIFSAQDLQTIFDPAHLARHAEPHKYWVPLIALFTGMRVNEIAQLYVEDIQTATETDAEGLEHTILYFDITPFREGQSIKTCYSMRRIPIHAQLLELGFERYVADVKASGAAHLFPGLVWEEGGPGRVISRWFNDYHLRRTCGITSAKKSLHCFRHTLTTRCERAHVPKSVIQTINGHSDGQGVDARTYVARGSLLECKQALERLTYPPLDLVPYASERFAAYLAQSAAQESHATRLAAEGKPIARKRGRRPKLQTRDLRAGIFCVGGT